MTLLERYLNYCESIETTPLYAEFSFYSLIAACLQRRSFTAGIDNPVYPNLYICFVGQPGTGKTNATKINKKILEKIVDVKTGSDNVPTITEIIPMAADATSVEALISDLAKGVSFFTVPGGNPQAHSSLSVVSEELGNLFKINDEDLTRFLLQGYDSESFKKRTKHCGNDYIRNMCLNFIAAATPQWMAKAMTHGIMNEGLIGRMIFISGGRPEVLKTFFETDQTQKNNFKILSDFCNLLARFCGPIIFTPESKEFLVNWYEKGGSRIRINPDKRLEHYYSRKKINIIKLSMLIRASKFTFPQPDVRIQIEDIEEAMAALLRAEVNMHEALSSMAKNPLHSLAMLILDQLKKTKGRKYSKQELWLWFNDEAKGEDIFSAIDFLIAAGKLKMGIRMPGGIPEFDYKD